MNQSCRAPILGLLLCGSSVALCAQTIDERARGAADAARSRSGNSEVILHNYVTPGLAGAPVTTINGATGFTPRIACKKSATLLEILVQPGASGDLSAVRIAHDRDIDGRFDSLTTLPVPVSGICANGVISCTPGQWTNCRYQRWSIDPAHTIALNDVPMSDLAGCYCINNSCGTNLAMANLSSILGDLGGGIVGALTTADSRIGVAQAQIAGPVITYTGAQTTACAADATVTATRYKADPAALAGDAFAEAASNPVFTALKASPAGVGKAQVTRACTIMREVTLAPTGFDDIVSVAGPVLSVASCGADCRRFRIGGDGNCSDAPPTFAAAFTIAQPDRLVSAKIVGMGAEDWVQAQVNGTILDSAGTRPWLTETIPTGECAVDGSWSNSTVHDLTATMKAGTTTIAARVRGGKEQRWGYVDVEIVVDASCRTSERLVDLCAPLAADAKCRLDGESVDGVTTFRNGVGTGLRPLPQTRLFGNAACTVRLSRDFFEKTRSYICAIDAGTVPEPDLSRGAYIIDHSTESLIADRIRSADGSVITSTRPFAMPERGSVPACETLCKTRAPKANADAAPQGVMASQQNNPTGWDSFYHVCGANNRCPVGPGEELVTDCGCLDDFPEAVVMMQTVRLGGADLSCTAEAR